VIIPDKVKVGAMTYAVVKVDGVLRKDDGNEKYGDINYNTQTIRLSGDTRFSGQTAQLTFFHELIHAFTHDRNLNWGDNDELYTEEIARALNAFCVDNNFGFIPQASV
jgi:Zn-dependent peptidase ImmA (M78 family)